MYICGVNENADGLLDDVVKKLRDDACKEAENGGFLELGEKFDKKKTVDHLRQLAEKSREVLLSRKDGKVSDGMLLLYAALFLQEDHFLSRGKIPLVDSDELEMGKLLGSGGSGIVFEAKVKERGEKGKE